jgi:hypothetical protein
MVTIAREKPMADDFRVSGLPTPQKHKLLEALGAKPETVKMVLELDEKINALRIKDSHVLAAWGLGCGGVSC